MEKLISICLEFMPILAILFVATVHSLTKVIVSTALGDNIAKNEGRLTLNPFKHIDAIGLLLLFFMHYGWDKPVKTSAFCYKNKKAGIILVNALPIVACFLVSAIALFIDNHFLAGITNYNVNRIIRTFVNSVALYGTTMGVFNIIPIYPMDGSGIIRAFLKPNNVIKYNQMEGILQMILVFALMLGIIGGFLDVISGTILNIFYLI